MIKTANQNCRHGHECMEGKGVTKNEKNGKTMEQLRVDTTPLKIIGTSAFQLFLSCF